jgi:hypothetical protein
MKWTKKGCIVKPGKFFWMVTHAQNPFAEKIKGDIYKIYFAGRDAQNRARGGSAIINITKPYKMLAMNRKPMLDLGELGCFDDCGVMPSCIINYNNQKYLYYTGWKKEVVTPFSFFIGLAVSKDGGKTFKRYSKAPILGRTYHDPYLTGSPWVIIENGIWRMWYVSGMGWEMAAGKASPKHYYRIRYTESRDGIGWDTNGTISIDFKKGEYAIGRPIVYKEDGRYKMWYCYRGDKNTYRAGYAESPDGMKWQRKDKEAGIDVSESGWDLEMICYPYVFKHKGKTYMLYNGNGYGKTGIGLAVLKK